MADGLTDAEIEILRWAARPLAGIHLTIPANQEIAIELERRGLTAVYESSDDWIVVRATEAGRQELQRYL